MAAENDDTTVRFEIAGQTYDYPDPLDLDLDEWVIIYDECGLILEDFAPLEDKAAASADMLRLEKELERLDDADERRPEMELKLQAATIANLKFDGPMEKARIKKLRNPALMKALAIVGYKRANPDQDIETARALIGGAKMLGLLESMAPDEADADDPTQDSPTTPDESSERSSDDSNGSSSASSQSSSDEPEDAPAPIGTGG